MSGDIRTVPDATLAAAWMWEGNLPMSADLARVRSWTLDELEARMGPERFRAWASEGPSADPLPFLTGEKTA